MSANRQTVASGSRSIASGMSKVGALRGPLAALSMLVGAVGCHAKPSLTVELRLERADKVNATRAVPGEYVVVFGDGIAGIPLEGETGADVARRAQALEDSAAMEAALAGADVNIQYRYGYAVIGFAGTLSPAALAAVMRATHGRARIERNRESRQDTDEVRPRDEIRPTDEVRPIDEIRPMMKALKVAASPPLPYGLDRIGQRLLELNKAFQRPMPGNREVHAYVIDSGILASHSEFLRQNGSSRVGNGYNAYTTAPTDNCLKHGTHVAGTIGGKNVGVAPFVELHSVRVIGCAGNVTSAAAIAGVDWVLAQYKSHKKSSVANMSLEFDLKIPNLDSAIRNSITAGITYVVAAGNRNYNACTVSPAGVQQAITVASVDPETDKKAGTSGGTCVDLFAPGEAIASATSTSANAWAYQDGTSSAAPHAAGVAALVLSRHNASPAAVWTAIANAANVAGTPYWCGVGGRGTAPNRLLHWGAALPNDGIKDSEALTGPPKSCSGK